MFPQTSALVRGVELELAAIFTDAMMTKVLIIEDESAIRENIVDILVTEGFEVLQASNGTIGVQIAQTEQPDLILCDVTMPDLTGYEVVKLLRQQPVTATTPFIFLTARAAKADFRQGMVAGANDYLTKPFTMAELLEAIRSQLDKQSAIAEKYQLELKQLEERFNQSFCYDLATGLPNQFLLRDQFRQLLDRRDSEAPIATLCVQLNQFERFSTALEPVLYDQLLQLLVDRLKTCIPRGDTISRLKENQFLLIVGNAASSATPEQMAQTVLDQLMQPFDVAGQRIYLSACIGISRYPEDGCQIEVLVRNAEFAVQAVPRQQTNSYQVYSAALSQRSLEQLLMESELRTAWEEANFQVYYQPQINAQTGEVVGAEALIRCLHPQKGMLSPAKFIPLAEETGLIVPIGEWVAKTACHQTRVWHGQQGPGLRIAVNLSSRQFNQPNLEQVITRLLAETGLAPDCLELEITESCIMEDLESAVAILRSFKDQGIRIALDDFGTGYSSLSYLKRIPLDTLKIDRSFICNVQNDPQNREIVKNIIQMAHNLGLKTVAEGVETEAELGYLQHHDCDELQGYFFSRPVPAPDLEVFLQTWPERAFKS